MAKCIGFQMKDVNAALQHMDYEIIRDYGDQAYDHYLHTWDDGKRLLGKCRKCGGYLLIQKSEFHSFTGHDSYYKDIFPVDSENEAEEMNKRFDGFEIEEKFPGTYIINDECRTGWKKGE